LPPWVIPAVPYSIGVPSRLEDTIRSVYHYEVPMGPLETPMNRPYSITGRGVHSCHGWPNTRSVPPPAVEGKDPEKETEGARFIGWWMPVDDQNTLCFHIEVVDPERPMFQPTGVIPDRPHEKTQRTPDDKEAQVGQWPIAVHAPEHLSTLERGVVMFRRLLREAIKAIGKGEDPPGTYRDLSNRIMKNQARHAVPPAQTEAAPH